MASVKLFRLSIIASFCVIFSSIGFAQSWQWGRASVDANLDSWAVATDVSGNVYAAAMNYADTV